MFRSQVQPQQHPHLSSIIQLYPDKEHNCAGYAPSKKRRCHIGTSADSQRSACSLLDKATTELHAGKSIDNLLYDLAPFVLCQRFHQNQAGELIAKWTALVSEFKAAKDAARARERMEWAAIKRLSIADRVELLEEMVDELVMECEEDRRRERHCRSPSYFTHGEFGPASTNVRSGQRRSSIRPSSSVGVNTRGAVTESSPPTSGSTASWNSTLNTRHTSRNPRGSPLSEATTPSHRLTTTPIDLTVSVSETRTPRANSQQASRSSPDSNAPEQTTMPTRSPSTTTTPTGVTRRESSSTVSVPESEVPRQTSPESSDFRASETSTPFAGSVRPTSTSTSTSTDMARRPDSQQASTSSPDSHTRETFTSSPRPTHGSTTSSTGSTRQSNPQQEPRNSPDINAREVPTPSPRPSHRYTDASISTGHRQNSPQVSRDSQDTNISTPVPRPTPQPTIISPSTPVTRKPVEEDCSICMLQMRDLDPTPSTEEEDGEDIVWCKARCGSNFHKTCLDPWISSCQRDNRQTTCPYCRAVWHV
ncbi:hypothetical protein PHISCL_01833 [Aspergillus sclerotialis]|uniref:RING-type domain-containing protein n=1 Tax=Aspergillus sclerotialis TaxID=2070753 RepID=A0A3A2ZWU1_9EURO|nr:hypothetical protein PHISCL_01833 [Aspergillus sclerotialis]